MIMEKGLEYMLATLQEDLGAIRKSVDEIPLRDLEREAWEALDELAPHDAQQLWELREILESGKRATD